LFFEKRQRKGITYQLAKKAMVSRNYFGSMMLDQGEADALLSGLSNDYPRTILPALQIVGVEKGINRVGGLYIISNNKGNFFFADTTVNLNPTEDELVDIIGLSSRAVRFFDTEPRIAALSYSNFGSAKGAVPQKMANAVAKAKKRWPNLLIDGDLQANVALNKELISELYPFSDLKGTFANTLIFPNLESGNIAYKLLMELGGAEAIGPILMGMRKSVHVLQLGSSVRDVFNMAAIAVVDAQTEQTREKL
jgi:malate dehydrogenase (oxaloacetate-decarboxylating)(NADP+)